MFHELLKLYVLFMIHEKLKNPSESAQCSGLMTSLKSFISFQKNPYMQFCEWKFLAVMKSCNVVENQLKGAWDAVCSRSLHKSSHPLNWVISPPAMPQMQAEMAKRGCSSLCYLEHRERGAYGMDCSKFR